MALHSSHEGQAPNLRIGLKGVSGKKGYTHKIVLFQGESAVEKLGSFDQSTGTVVNVEEMRLNHWLNQGVELTLPAALALINQRVYKEVFGDESAGMKSLIEGIQGLSLEARNGASPAGAALKDLASEDPRVRHRIARELGKAYSLKP